MTLPTSSASHAPLLTADHIVKRRDSARATFLTTVDHHRLRWTLTVDAYDFQSTYKVDIWSPTASTWNLLWELDPSAYSTDRLNAATGSIAIRPHHAFDRDPDAAAESWQRMLNDLAVHVAEILDIATEPASKTGAQLAPGDTLIGDDGGRSVIYEAGPSATVPGAQRVETEHGPLYLDAEEVFPVARR